MYRSAVSGGHMTLAFFSLQIKTNSILEAYHKAREKSISFLDLGGLNSI